LKVNDLILEPLASSAAVLSNDEKEVGVALVDIGGGTSDVAVFHDGVLVHTAVIPMGGNLITSDIKSAYNILERQAEELKLQYGSAIPEKTQEGFIITIPGLKGRPPKQISLVDLNMIIKARVEEIVHAVKFQIELSQKEDQLGAGIVICGGGALLKNIRQLISHLTNYDVRIGYSTEHLSSNVVEEINQPQFATSLGLIMKAYEMQNENNNVKSKLGLQETKQEAETEQEVEEVETRKKSKRQKTKRQKQGDESSSNLIDKLKDKMSRLFEEDEDVEDL
ncbi:MAG: cell division protein FtsA, partial [Bacteroidales bacterium]|nr:cell division protein FtsA [Bacteroidales bacterium]